ncbi:MAG: hypothetical protein WCX83_00335 [Candidatus Cloacimonas sp.]
MHRDDIKDKVIELLQEQFPWLNDDEDNEDGISNTVKSEYESFDALGLSRDDVREFTEVLLENFELEHIEFSEVMKWQRVKDVIGYIREVKC